MSSCIGVILWLVRAVGFVWTGACVSVRGRGKTFGCAVRGLIMNVLTRMSTNGAALSRKVLCLAKGVHGLKQISRGSTCLSACGLRQRQKVAVFSGRTRFRLKGEKVALLSAPKRISFSTRVREALRILSCTVLMVGKTSNIRKRAVAL